MASRARRVARLCTYVLFLLGVLSWSAGLVANITGRSPSTSFRAAPVSSDLLETANAVNELTPAGEDKAAGIPLVDSGQEDKGFRPEEEEDNFVAKNVSVVFDEEYEEKKRFLSVEELINYVDYYAAEYRRRVNKRARANWAYITNNTWRTNNARMRSVVSLLAWEKSEWKQNISTFDLRVMEEPGYEEIKRVFDRLKIIGIAALDKAKMAQRTQLITDMHGIHGGARVCPYKNQQCDPRIEESWSLEPDLTDVMREFPNPNNYDKLLYAWEKWREKSGKPVRKTFIDFVKISNEGALANNVPSIKNAGDLWVQPYEDENFRDDIQRLYSEVKPFYHEIHAFVRHKLSQFYGEDKVDPRGHIPAHVLGNMWAQRWDFLFPAVSEFPYFPLDVTREMILQNYTVRRMFETSDDFFVNMGLSSVKDTTVDFYGLSMLEKPADGRRVFCRQTLAVDFFATTSLPADFRVKMCADVTMRDLVTAHDEVAYIQYYIQYVDQLPLFRGGANPGFPRAVADTIGLSTSTTKYLKSIGLLDEAFELSAKDELAFLLKTGLEKIPLLAFAYLVDLYGWKIFNGSISTDDLNSEWWRLREGYQGIKAPLPRSEEDFDAGCKFHVIASTPYVKYFVARIMQFMFHQSLCEAAGQYDPANPDSQLLHSCSIHGSTAAGAKLKKLMQAGSSVHWKDTLYKMTGSREISVEPMLNYFKPLRTYLQDYIAVNEVHVGWENDL